MLYFAINRELGQVVLDLHGAMENAKDVDVVIGV